MALIRRGADRVIMKIQISVAGNNGERVLVYPRNRHLQWEGEITDAIREQMKGRHKAFFYAEFGPGGYLGLTSDEAPEQEW